MTIRFHKLNSKQVEIVVDGNVVGGMEKFDGGLPWEMEIVQDGPSKFTTHRTLEGARQRAREFLGATRP